MIFVYAALSKRQPSDYVKINVSSSRSPINSGLGDQICQNKNYR